MYRNLAQGRWSSTSESAMCSTTGGGRFAGKDESSSRVTSAQLQKDKERLETEVKELNVVIQDQLTREDKDKRKLKETENSLHSARAELRATKAHIEQIQAEKVAVDQRAHQYWEQYQKEQENVDKYRSSLRSAQDLLEQGKKQRGKLQLQLQQVQGNYDREKERTKQIVERCLALLRSSKEGEGIFHGRLGISFENAQQEKKYQGMALRIINELEPNATTIIGAQPQDKEFDIILHLARTEGGRTVNLEPSVRQEFKCGQRCGIK